MKRVPAGALRVTCPHCGAHGEAVDMLDRVDWNVWPLPKARFTCCGLWGDLAVAEPTPEETA